MRKRINGVKTRVNFIFYTLIASMCTIRTVGHVTWKRRLSIIAAAKKPADSQAGVSCERVYILNIVCILSVDKYYNLILRHNLHCSSVL